MPRSLSKADQVGQSVIKQFRKPLWRPFLRAVRQYGLVEDGDRIAVCVSGGKDSMLLCKLMQELQRHSEFHFEPVFLAMDPGYDAENRRHLEENAEIMGIPLTIFESDVFDASLTAERNPCFLCARMRRGCLYGKAQALGCNKIALGHHMDDVIETTVMAMFYGSHLQAMPPMLHAKNYPGMSLIRPMYMIREQDVIDWAAFNELSFMRCACKLTRSDYHEDGTLVSKRKETKELLAQLRRTNPGIDMSIFNAIHRCSLDSMVGYRWRGESHDFREIYEQASPMDNGID